MRLRSPAKTERRTEENSNSHTAIAASPLQKIQIRRILVPVDFSDCSAKAVNYAVSLARRFHAEIALLFVMHPPVYLEGTMVAVDSGIAGNREAAAAKLSEWREKIEPGLTVRTHVRTGTAYNEIRKVASEADTDLIIIGTHGRTGLAHALIGSTTERVVRYAPCPVLIVRQHEHDFVPVEEHAQHQAAGN